MKKTVKFLVILILLGGLGYGAYQNYQTTQTAPAVMQQAAPVVDVMTVGAREVMPEVGFVAKIEAQNRVGLRARVTGFLQERLFTEGDVVQKGQPLLIIEPVNFEARVRQAEANLARAKAESVNADAQYERTKTLFKTKDVSAAKLDEMQAAKDSAAAAVAQMRAALDLAKKDLEYTTIVAPMDGKIGEMAFSVGELIGPESGVLVELVSINPIDAVFSVSENQLLTLQEQFGDQADTEVDFITANGKVYPHTGKIDFVDIALDEAMNTLKLKASFPNPEQRLIAGQYGRVLLKSKRKVSKIVIPMQAVQRGAGNAYVYVVGNDHKIMKQEVQTGLELPNFDVVIESGLTGGEQVVVAGFQKIAVGATVSPNLIK